MEGLGANGNEPVETINNELALGVDEEEAGDHGDNARRSEPSPTVRCWYEVHLALDACADRGRGYMIR